MNLQELYYRNYMSWGGYLSPQQLLVIFILCFKT